MLDEQFVRERTSRRRGLPGARSTARGAGSADGAGGAPRLGIAVALLGAGLAGFSGCALDEAETDSEALWGGDRGSLVYEVRRAAASHDVRPIPPAPEVSDELFELGQALMFDKILSGDKDVSCMTCHPPEAPTFTGDGRHLSLGVNGVDEGEARIGGTVHVRHSLPLFNLHALDVMFFDGRVERIFPFGDDGGDTYADDDGAYAGAGGDGAALAAHAEFYTSGDASGFSGDDGDYEASSWGNWEILRTPADEEITPEMRRVFDFGHISAQPMFPVVARTEMRGQRFKNGPQDNELAENLEFTGIWAALMNRLGDIPEYVAMFEAAYPGTDFEDMTFAHAANAMAAFEIRAFESRGSPFQQFLRGDHDALSDSALRGARDFFAEGSCGTCHSGPLLTDQKFHNTGLAQFGPGQGDGQYDNDDLGRAGATFPFELGRLPGGPFGLPDRCYDEDNPFEKYAFRPPPLHNVAVTGPWGHAGQFSDLRDFVSHYEDPEAALRDYDLDAQLLPNERDLDNMRVHNTEAVLSCLDADAQVSIRDMDDLIAFLESLTDPAALDLGGTIPDEVPSGLPVSNGEAPEIGGEAEGTVTFANIADDPDSGLDQYRRAPSDRNAIAEQKREESLEEPQQFPDIFETPLRPRGMPGVAIFDYDGDGDEDVFATNGPGRPNSLFESQLADSGQLDYVDRADVAGVAAASTDSSGVCYGDIDNDGDHDLYVVADKGRSHLYRNEGDGTFTDISDQSGANPDGTGGTSCSFGDINGDGLLDLTVARAWHQEDVHACFTTPFGAGIQHNELYVNEGGGTFQDVSDTSGIRELGGLPAFAEGEATITWGIAMVDYDLDGDVDILTADDQCAVPNHKLGGVSRGFLQVFDNDGTGHFTNRTVEAGTNAPSAWMGLSFGDFNSDGYLDFFSPSFGDWGKPFAGAPVIVGDETSRWYLGGPNKTFYHPTVGDLKNMPFGWGTSARDFDRDGDTDINFYGGLDLWFFVDRSNPGSMLVNDGNAGFGLDRGAFETNHSRRNTAGSAAGDVNGDGFPDIVTVSNFDIPGPVPLRRYGSDDVETYYFSIFDESAFYAPTFELINPPNPEIDHLPDYDFEPANKGERRFQYNEDMRYTDGTITVEVNSADNGNHWASLRLVGAAGLVPDAEANRDAIGAMITFTPDGGSAVMAPVLGGSSHLSQDSLTQGFGLGGAASGTADILWPGGTKNRLYDVGHGEALRVPELPCSYDTSDDRATYAACVDGALADLGGAGLVDAGLAARMRSSALRAYDETH